MAAPIATTLPMRGVDLGFIVEEADREPWRLLSHHFPSKIGGRPAWLALMPLPSEADLRCGRCEKPCTFLAQAYAPITDDPSCFHRTIFLFICPNPHCCELNKNANLVVFRSQLARKNEFYSFEPPMAGELDRASGYPETLELQSLCRVCGCAGTKKCGRCQRTTYCSKEHQTVDWKVGGHKLICGTSDQNTLSVSVDSNLKMGVLFNEFELDYEGEGFESEKSVEKSEKEKMEEYQKFTDSLKLDKTENANKDATTFSVKELEFMTDSKTKDKQFTAFRKRIDLYPEQVIRYQRGGEPLWVTDDPIPQSEQIPPCQYCSAPRQFEFQVQPQLLSHLDVDRVDRSVDWGTLVVYTCANSCQAGGQYGREFVWKQDFDAKACA